MSDATERLASLLEVDAPHNESHDHEMEMLLEAAVSEIQRLRKGDAGRASYHDAKAMVECFDDGEGKVKVSLPSDVWLTPKQAEHFGWALVRCARSARF